MLASLATNARVNWVLRGRYVFSGFKRGECEVCCCGFKASGGVKRGTGVGPAMHYAVVSVRCSPASMTTNARVKWGLFSLWVWVGVCSVVRCCLCLCNVSFRGGVSRVCSCLCLVFGVAGHFVCLSPPSFPVFFVTCSRCLCGCAGLRLGDPRVISSDCRGGGGCSPGASSRL